MAGAEHNIERCLVCDSLLTSKGQCSTCKTSGVKKSSTVTDLEITKIVAKKNASKKDRADFQVDFQSAEGLKNKHLLSPAFLFDKISKERFELSHAVTKVGRDRANSIVIAADRHISRYHAWIFHNKGKFWVEDLGATNGTLLNGKPVDARMQLKAGDKLTFGKTELIFVVD